MADSSVINLEGCCKKTFVSDFLLIKVCSLLTVPFIYSCIRVKYTYMCSSLGDFSAFYFDYNYVRLNPICTVFFDLKNLYFLFIL